MTPDDALAKQIEMYRQMTGQERLTNALDLHEFACNISRDGIRRQYPGASEEEVERHLRRRIELGRRSEQQSREVIG
jgi:type II secretory pathway predicted ATPase ExeA